MPQIPSDWSFFQKDKYRSQCRGDERPDLVFWKMKILVCNSGSSSLKFSLFEADQELLLAEGSIDWTTRPTRLVFRRPGQPEIREELHLREHSEALGRILSSLQAGPSAPLQDVQDIDAVGHRVVHGGRRFAAAARITPEVKSAIGELSELAPLHNPASLIPPTRAASPMRTSPALRPPGGSSSLQPGRI